MRRKRTPFHDLRSPRAPAALRRRTLEAARQAAAEASDPPSSRPTRPRLADRLWTSRPLRLAWALLMLGLLGVNLTLERFVLDPERGARAAEASHRSARLQRDPGGSRTLLGSRETVLRTLLEDERPEPRGRRP